jgi:homocitrate synthase NifV
MARLRLADTVGILTPMQTFHMVTAVRAAAPGLPIEFHGHNDLGMATANAVAAFEAGAEAASVTVNGLGERAGNAPLEEVSMALRVALRRECGIRPRCLPGLCRLVAECSNRQLYDWKPVVSQGAFSHEAGIHCSALLHDRNTYEAFSPEEVGIARPEFVIGRHSGRQGLAHALKRLGTSVPHGKLDRLLDQIRSIARKQGGALNAKTLRRLAHMA